MAGTRWNLQEAGLAGLRALGVFALFRFLTRKQLRILCYHGGCMGDESQFNGKLFSSGTLVNQRLGWMARHGYTPVTLDAAVNALGRRDTGWTLPVVITVDDGWFSSRAHVIEPILKASFEVTLYLATEVMERGTPVPDVVLNYLFWKAGKRVHAISGVPGLPDGDYDLSKRPVRQEVERLMEARLKSLGGDVAAVRAEIEQFALAVGVAAEVLGLGSRRFSYLDPAELRELQQQGCDLQLHGHTHQYPVGQPEALHRDIALCHAAIVGAGLPPPSHYCYPSGEFDAQAPALLAAIQVQSGTTCIPGLISFSNPPSPYLLPRFLDGEDVSPLKFEAEMSGLLEFARGIRSRLRGRSAHPA